MLLQMRVPTNCAASLCLCLASSNDKDRAAKASRVGGERVCVSRGYSSAASAPPDVPPPLANDSLSVRFNSDPANLIYKKVVLR